MNILVVIVVWVILSVFFIFLGINSIFNGLSVPWSNIIFFFILWLVLSCLIIVFFYLRHKSKKETRKLLATMEENPTHSYDEGEYFYQTPLIIFDNLRKPILGNKQMSYKPFFNNTLQKLVSLLDFFALFGIKLTSEDYNLVIKRIKWWHLRPHHKVYLNEQEVGILFQKKLFSKKGFQKMPYQFIDNQKYSYVFENPFFSQETVIKNDDNQILLKGKRSFFDIGKNDKTNQLGETHNLKVSANYSDYPEELWIALYIQVMVTQQTMN
ncbi:hypothetical protein E2556_01780 [Staphylococcus croceilyticus]|uniref:Uncharacterized protein n=1 Tax=Staphylococcus croceilyticus TaxID=319942 RepID=A0ABY2KJE6_9STAP|nr:hypothetical protein [Staphylococcus croceilyticus]PNZ66712.1 hypothetical protein CD128_09670 [Staphylococcus croceilyticus]TGA81070.1 hypothetical protein E2556_01780 [Staphylococcus croceilyticus]